MINTIINPPKTKWYKISERNLFRSKDLKKTVNNIIENVKINGDKALVELTETFDDIKLNKIKYDAYNPTQLKKYADKKLQSALKVASANITKFHTAQKRKNINVKTSDGIECSQKYTPIEKVGLYIPGGTAPLISTVLMLAIPAKIAGCKNIVVCTPLDKKTKKIPKEILIACSITGIKHIYAIGGAQAIAAMAYGTQTVPKVYKIFGPGNQYVTMAKAIVSLDNIAIDMPAGPSELCVWADKSSIPKYIAADLLSQAEHGTDSQVIAVSTNAKVLENIKTELTKQIKKLPRKKIALEALKNSHLVQLNKQSDIIDFINQYAAEHLIIATDNATEKAKKITNAGSIFLGHHSPESIGDYASGTNHTLPTNGTAVAYSGITLDSFYKTITIQQITPNGLKKIGPHVEVMATAEGLYAHKNAVTIRLNDLN